MSADWWVQGLTEQCLQFQVDLSCLVDGELDEVAGGRAIAHLESCPECQEFFDDVREQVRAHREMAEPERLVEQYSSLLGVEVGEDVESPELVSRLSTVFYQLGKSYVLLATDPDFRTRVFETAVPVEETRVRGRGFVDGVLESGRGSAAGFDWAHARGMLNGQLERIESPLEKGRRLLEEALAADESNDEARLYLAFADVHEGKVLRASAAFRRVFETAATEFNRGHAALQLARLHSAEGDYRKALAYCRWITMSGLADVEERFYVARYNIATYWARLRRPRRCVTAFRELLDRHPERSAEVAGFLAGSPKLQAVVESQSGLAERLLERCPELFTAPDEEQASGRSPES